MADKKIDKQLFDALAEILKKNELTEIEFSEGERKIKLVKAPPTQAPFAPQPMVVPAGPAASAQAVPSSESTTDTFESKDIVKSPMVGTVYTAPSPDADVFIKEGVEVDAGQTLIIIEAMKVMNPIKAPHAGMIRKIFVENGQPVEFDEQLVVIEP